MGEVVAPRVEGTVGVGDGRRLGFAEFGPPDGRAVIWLHGTPGARRQIPTAARRYAEAEGVRIVGVDRPGIGSSTSHLYGQIIDFATDLEQLADVLGLGDLVVIGLSGGGPYALGAAVAMADRVRSVGVLGGVAPTVGPDAIAGGVVALGKRAAPLVNLARVPLGIGLTAAVRLSKPLAPRFLDLYARFTTDGDRKLLSRPEFKAMFLDDLLNGSRKQLSAPLADILLFARHWGFVAADVDLPVHWWHGDDDHIVPVKHGEHMVGLLPDATLHLLPGESHLAGLGLGDELLSTLLPYLDGTPRGTARAQR